MKHIIITGAASGIGEATARLLANHGHALMLASRNIEKLERLRKELGKNVLCMACDVARHDDVVEMVNYSNTVWGRVDGIINNAGVGYFESLEKGSIDHWHTMFDVNVKGLLSCVHSALPYLLKSNGHIINIGSVGSHHVFPNSGIYCASKHAVLAISESLRIELGDRIRITTISPGSVNTPFINQTTNEEMLLQYRDYFAAGLDPELVAQQVKYAIDCPPEANVSEIILRPVRKIL